MKNEGDVKKEKKDDDETDSDQGEIEKERAEGEKKRRRKVMSSQRMKQTQAQIQQTKTGRRAAGRRSGQGKQRCETHNTQQTEKREICVMRSQDQASESPSAFRPSQHGSASNPLPVEDD